MISEDQVLEFASASLKSVWALELLLTLRGDPARRWSINELIRELRSSQVGVADALENLRSAGLVVEEEGPTYRYRTVSPTVDEFVVELGKTYATKPVSVVRAIVLSPTRKLQILSDAFRIKE